MNEKFCILISLKFVPKCPIDKNPEFIIQHQVIIWTNADPIHQCIYAALGRNELNIRIEKKF